MRASYTKLTKELGVLTQIGGDWLALQLLCWMLEEEAWERRRRIWAQAQFSVPAPLFQSSSLTVCSQTAEGGPLPLPTHPHQSVHVPRGKSTYFWNSPTSCDVWLCAAQRVREHGRVHGICLETIYCLLKWKNSGSGRPDDSHHSAQLLSL